MAISSDSRWSSSWEVQETPDQKPEEFELIKEVKKRYGLCQDWEAEPRVRFDYDYKFANGDTHNKYQWDSDLVDNRELEDKPCLTVNKTQQHNLMVINDAKQNKSGIRIRPVSDEATFEASQVYQELIYHIEYISSAENVYDSAVTFQVEAGIGYWRINTEFITKSFDQEIYIRRIKDPRSVYLDPDINEVDGSDSRYGIIFEDMPKDTFKEHYPKFASIASLNTIGNGSLNDGWITREIVRIAEYYRKNEKETKLVTFTNPSTQEQIIKYVEEFTDQEKITYQALNKGTPQEKEMWTFRQRKDTKDEIEWFKIAGDRVIETGIWKGKYIPIVRLPGTETVIDGILDRKGHTRALINAQQIYNYNTSANVEYGALQTKSPWIAPAKAIENYEEYYKTANTINHSYMPYNHIDDDGNPIPPPTRPPAPAASPAYVEQLKIAQDEMMMASGQYQAQFGENENAKSGVAIGARQRQGDRATYHFLDNLAIAIRFTGRILVDLIPKIYDTKRMKQILTRDGSKKNIIIDPALPTAHQDMDTLNQDKDRSEWIEQIAVNPNVGIYDIQSDSGPSFATKRQEQFNALTQIAAQNKDFMSIGGDLYFKSADFPDADVLAERWRRIIPPNIVGDQPDPHAAQLMHQASDKIEQLTQLLAKTTKDLADKNRELDIRERDLALKEKETSVSEQRADYDAETKRLVALGNSGPGLTVEQIQPLVKQMIVGMLEAGNPGSGNIRLPGPHEGGTPIQLPEPGANETPTGGTPTPVETPPMPGARKAKDGKFYLPDPKRAGKFLRVEMNGA